jgi:hypothetical protein
MRITNQLNLWQQIKLLPNKLIFKIMNEMTNSKQTSSPSQDGIKKAIKDLEEKIVKTDVSDLKKIVHPPSTISGVADSICIIFAKKPSYKNFLSILDNNLLNNLIPNYNANITSDYVIKQLDQLNNNNNNNNADLIEISKLCFYLSKWIKEIHNYALMKRNDVKNDVFSIFFSFFSNFFHFFLNFSLSKGTKK